MYDLIIFEETENETNRLEMNPEEVKRIPYRFVPVVSDIGSEIQVKHFCNEFVNYLHLLGGNLEKIHSEVKMFTFR